MSPAVQSIVGNSGWYVMLAMVGTALATSWQYLKGWFSRLRSLVVVNVTLEGSYAVAAVLHHLRQSYRQGKLGDRLFVGITTLVKPLQRVQRVCFESLDTPSMKFFWKGWCPVMMGYTGATTGSGGSSPSPGKSTLSYIRGTLDIEKFMAVAFEGFNGLSDAHNKADHEQYSKTRFFVKHIVGDPRRNDRNSTGGEVANKAPGSGSNDTYGPEFRASHKPIGWDLSELFANLHLDPFDGLVYPDYVKELVAEVERWRNSRDWFQLRRIPWRRGWLLKGKPGTGKSSLVRAIGQMLGMPIYVFDIATLTNAEMMMAWKEMLGYGPCFALIEDIDAVFEGRRRIKEATAGEALMTFDCLLNCISGVEPADGIFTIVTTNHPEKIDPALGVCENGISSRPGRLDRIVELKGMTRDCRVKLASFICSDCPDEIDRLVNQSNDYTAAQFQELCGQVALKRYWEEKTKVENIPPIDVSATFVGDHKSMLKRTPREHVNKRGHWSLTDKAEPIDFFIRISAQKDMEAELHRVKKIRDDAPKTILNHDPMEEKRVIGSVVG